MHWKKTKEGIPYLEIDSMPMLSSQSAPLGEGHKRIFREFLQQTEGKVEIVLGVPFTLRIKK